MNLHIWNHLSLHAFALMTFGIAVLHWDIYFKEMVAS